MLITTIENNIAIVQLNNGKVNAISHQLIKELKESFLSLTENPLVHGVILTGHTGAFSAGLDVVEQAHMNEGNPCLLDGLLWRFTGFMVRYPRPFVCAITGFAPAGGTILALCADYRIMAEEPKHVIGMHEFKLSMIVPELMMDLWCYTLENKSLSSFAKRKTLFCKRGLRREYCSRDCAR